MRLSSITRFYTLALLMVLVMVPFAPEKAQANALCTLDGDQRTVCLSAYPKRIISLSPGATELLFEAGAGQQVIATDKHSDYPPAVKQLPNVGGYPNTSAEAIVQQQPDLVVIWSNGNSPTLVGQLKKLGLRTFHINVTALADIPRTLQQLGRITGNTVTANNAAATFNQRLTALRNTYQARTPVTVFYEVWQDPLMTVGRDQVTNEVITVCGGHNVFGTVPQPIPRISMESLLAKNPQVIIDTAPNGPTPEHRQQQIKHWQQWPMLAAVQQQQFITLNSNTISRPTSRLLDGTTQLCQQLDAVRRTLKQRARATHTRNTLSP